MVDVSFDMILDQKSRIEREVIEPSDPASDAKAEMYDVMEEYCKH